MNIDHLKKLVDAAHRRRERLRAGQPRSVPPRDHAARGHVGQRRFISHESVHGARVWQRRPPHAGDATEDRDVPGHRRDGAFVRAAPRSLRRQARGAALSGSALLEKRALGLRQRRESAVPIGAPSPCAGRARPQHEKIPLSPLTTSANALLFAHNGGPAAAAPSFLPNAANRPRRTAPRRSCRR